MLRKRGRGSCRRELERSSQERREELRFEVCVKTNEEKEEEEGEEHWPGGEMAPWAKLLPSVRT